MFVNFTKVVFCFFFFKKAGFVYWALVWSINAFLNASLNDFISSVDASKFHSVYQWIEHDKILAGSERLMNSAPSESQLSLRDHLFSRFVMWSEPWDYH